MGINSEVKVLSQAGHSEGREAQGHGGDKVSEGSVERNRGLMNKNRIRGADNRGERANDREASVTKGPCVNPAAVRGRLMFLFGEISPQT